MPEQQRNQSDSATDRLQPFSCDVRAQSSEPSAALEAFELVTLPSVALDEPIFEPPTFTQDSPDDLFSERFGVVPGGGIAFDPKLSAFLDRALAQIVSEGLFDFESAEPQGLAIRRGGSGTLSDELAVRWLSYIEAQTESSLLPDFHAVQAIANAESSELEVDVQGVERFSSGEARVLMIGEGEDIGLAVFVPAVCRAEAIEHFIRAVAGSREPSFLYNALEQEVVRVLEGDTPVGSKDYQDVLIWIRANLFWSVAGFNSVVTCGAASESVVLDLAMTDPESQDFLETFGVPQLRCTVSFGNAQGALVERPTFEWAHIKNS